MTALLTRSHEAQLRDCSFSSAARSGVAGTSTSAPAVGLGLMGAGQAPTSSAGNTPNRTAGTLPSPKRLFRKFALLNEPFCHQRGGRNNYAGIHSEHSRTTQ